MPTTGSTRAMRTWTARPSRRCRTRARFMWRARAPTCAYRCERSHSRIRPRRSVRRRIRRSSSTILPVPTRIRKRRSTSAAACRHCGRNGSPSVTTPSHSKARPRRTAAQHRPTSIRCRRNQRDSRRGSRPLPRTGRASCGEGLRRRVVPPGGSRPGGRSHAGDLHQGVPPAGAAWEGGALRLVDHGDRPECSDQPWAAASLGIAQA